MLNKKPETFHLSFITIISVSKFYKIAQDYRGGVAVNLFADFFFVRADFSQIARCFVRSKSLVL